MIGIDLSKLAGVYYNDVLVDALVMGNTIIWKNKPSEPTVDVSKALKFTAVDGDTTLSMNNINDVVLYWSDGFTDFAPWDGTELTILQDNSIYIKGTNTTISTSSQNNLASSTRFIMGGTGKISCSGNIMHLLGENVTEITSTYCFRYLFNGCSKLTTAPELPATTLANYCYGNMFANCSSLTTAPKLPATTLTYNCYNGMFNGCSKLTTAPELPATTLATGCYASMFYGCTSLVNAPVLPATTLATSCYQHMFRGCTSLVTAPQLPVTTLALSCYGSMFYGCTSLVNAPVLPATTLAIGCYQSMFYGCINLNYIKMLATDISATNCLTSWVSSVSSTGTFVKDVNMTSLTTGVSGIPEGWTVEDYGEEPTVDTTKALKFTAVGDSVDLGFENNEGLELYWSDGFTDFALWDGTTLTISQNESIYIKGQNTSFYSNGVYKYFTTSGNGKLECEGSVMYLLGEDVTEITEIRCFMRLFYNCTNLVTAPELPATSVTQECYMQMFSGCTSLTTAPELPATTLANYCYGYMFNGCTSLTSAPKLPATTLVSNCYRNMFAGCTSLVNAPELPANTLVSNCYQYMFNGCTSLTTAPELPATTLANYCYTNMFNGCTSLTSAPKLPATTLMMYCYYNMFKGCTALNYIKMMATDISATNCLNNWVNNVASTGTFYKHPNMTTLPTGVSGIPEGWTVEDYGEEPTVDTTKALKFTAIDDAVDLGFTNNTSAVLYSSTDGEEWTSWDGTAISIAVGDSVYIKGENTRMGTSTSTYSKFTTSGSGKLECSGNIMYLLGENVETITLDYCFIYLFRDCKNLVYTNNLLLPSNTVTNYCYRGLFRGCTNLITSPLELPANDLRRESYQEMFYGCTSLTTAPNIAATTLQRASCAFMFTNTDITTAPQLQSEILTQECYYQMFNGCSSLKYIKMMATDISGLNCLTNWVSSVSSTGTFVKNADATWTTTGSSGVPSGWTIEYATA